MWEFPSDDAEPGYSDTRIFVKDNDGTELVLVSIEIKSQLYPHPAGRCVSVVVNAREPSNRSIHVHTHTILRTTSLPHKVQLENKKKFGFLKISSPMFDGIVGHDGRVYSVQWKLLPNEEFLDGAIRIGVEILTKTGAAGRYSHFRSKWMMGNFSVKQETLVNIKNPKVKNHYAGTHWQPIEYWLRFKHGLQE